MKDIKDLIRFLYDAKEDINLRDDLLNLAEQIETENRIEVNKGPLAKALSAVGVSVPDDKLVPDYASVVAHFDSALDYQNAANKLESPEGMEKLAELGWVMNLSGNSDPGQEDYRIRFLELELHDGKPDDSKKPVNPNKEMEKVAKQFSVDKEDPKRKMQKSVKNESFSQRRNRL